MNLRGLHDLDVKAIEEWLANVASGDSLDLAQMFLLRCSVGRIAANNIRSGYQNVIVQLLVSADDFKPAFFIAMAGLEFDFATTAKTNISR